MNDFVSMYTSDQFLNYFETLKRRARRRFEFHKRALTRVYHDHNITKVEYQFNGCGDQGEVELTTYFDKDGNPVDLPEGVTALYIDAWDNDDPLPRISQQAIYRVEDYLASDALELADHGGWENNSGAEGSIDFLVTENKVIVHFFERYETLSDEDTSEV